MLALLGNGIARLFRNAPLNRIGQAHTPTQPGRLRRPDQAYRDDIGVVVSETEQQKLVRGLHLRDLAGGEELRVRPVVGYLQEIRLAADAVDLHVVCGPVSGIVYPANEVRLSLATPFKPAVQAGNGRRQRDVRMRRISQQCPIGLRPVMPGPPTVIPAMTADTTADPVEIHADQSIIALAS